jgi:hypothetical protein
MSMLINLPDMNSSSINGGWLFEYAFEPLLAESAVVAHRWRYFAAHSIDNPISAKKKKGTA